MKRTYPIRIDSVRRGKYRKFETWDIGMSRAGRRYSVGVTAWGGCHPTVGLCLGQSDCRVRPSATREALCSAAIEYVTAELEHRWVRVRALAEELERAVD